MFLNKFKASHNVVALLELASHFVVVKILSEPNSENGFDCETEHLFTESNVLV